MFGKHYNNEESDPMYKIIHIDGNKLNNKPTNLKQVLNEASNPTQKEREIIATDLDTGQQRRFKSIYQVSKATGINPGSMKLIANGKRKTVTSKMTNHKLTFEYANTRDLDAIKTLQERIRRRLNITE